MNVDFFSVSLRPNRRGSLVGRAGHPYHSKDPGSIPENYAIGSMFIQHGLPTCLEQPRNGEALEERRNGGIPAREHLQQINKTVNWPNASKAFTKRRSIHWRIRFGKVYTQKKHQTHVPAISPVNNRRGITTRNHSPVLKIPRKWTPHPEII
jgi:hypothetical protein